jgi:hypothetical protein
MNHHTNNTAAPEPDMTQPNSGNYREGWGSEPIIVVTEVTFLQWVRCYASKHRKAIAIIGVAAVAIGAGAVWYKLYRVVEDLPPVVE